jgi:glycosyltransferase involved in cell wall biosynthesis
VDLHHVREIREAEINQDRRALEAAKQTEALETSLALRANTTIVISEAEKKILQEKAPEAKIRIIPLIFEGRTQERVDSVLPVITFLGSFLHQPNVDSVNWLISEIWPKIKSVNPNARLNIVGDDPAGNLRKLPLEGPGITYRGWVKDLDPVIAETQVWVAPLRYGAGVKGKIGLAMGNQIPVVTTSIGAEGMGLIDGHTALVKDGADDFAVAVLQLLSDQRLRASLSKNALDLFNRSFSLEVVAPKVLEIFQDEEPQRNPGDVTS